LGRKREDRLCDYLVLMAEPAPRAEIESSQEGGKTGSFLPFSRVHVTRTLIIIISIHAIFCSRGEPPTPDVSPSVALPELPAPARVDPLTATASSAAPEAPRSKVTELFDASSPRLPQTRERPALSSAAFERGTAALWAAIAKDDPALAMPFFFPLDAYEQVKDVGDPAADWKHRLVAAYERDIHALHARLGAEADTAHFVTLEVPEGRARWVEPGEEWNKLGYYRVFGSKLRFEVDGGAGTFEIKSLISWRGEWYVVHLSAIK
jgi:hypothetical protein